MSDTSLVNIKERFPSAQVQGARSLQEVLDAWEKRGLNPVELTTEETIQRITIEHDPLNGKLTWTISRNMDGLMATLIATNTLVLMPSLIVSETVKSIATYFVEGEGRGDLGSGEAMVLIAFKDGRLVIDSMPKDNKIAIRKLLAATLITLLAQDNRNPIEEFAGTLFNK
jgi:hypothetical protein